MITWILYEYIPDFTKVPDFSLSYRENDTAFNCIEGLFKNEFKGRGLPYSRKQKLNPAFVYLATLLLPLNGNLFSQIYMTLQDFDVREVLSIKILSTNYIH